MVKNRNIDKKRKREEKIDKNKSQEKRLEETDIVLKRTIEELKKENKIKTKKKKNNGKLIKKILNEQKELKEQMISKKFFITLKILIDSEYLKGDVGTMYYQYEKNEFYKTVNYYKKFINIRQGTEKKTAIMIIINSKRISTYDMEGNSSEQIKIMLIKYLLDSGAKLVIKDTNGYSALTYAYLLYYKSDLYNFIFEETENQQLQINDKGDNVLYEKKDEDEDEEDENKFLLRGSD